jgi:hypothetical protein
MSNAPKIERPPFLTPEREQYFRNAVHRSNAFQQSIIQTEGHVHEHMNNQGKALTLRAWTTARIMEHFSGDPGAQTRHIFNMSCIEFDKVHIIRFVKISDPLNPPTEPKTITDARNRPLQPFPQPLPGLESEVKKPQFTPLENLIIYSCGYVVNHPNIITNLYFINQEGDIVHSYYELDLSTVVEVKVPENTEQPRGTFKLKGSNRNQEAQ